MDPQKRAERLQGQIASQKRIKAHSKKKEMSLAQRSSEEDRRISKGVGRTNMTDKIEVLDKGYVRYIKHMGDDLDPVNSAKVSFAKESVEFGDREARLLAFLQREEHSSVFRHSALTFEVYAPLFVARQWWKYAVASTHLEDQNGWNESSRRYVTETPEFYVPSSVEWRSAPENRKQGSGEAVSTDHGEVMTDSMVWYINQGLKLYEEANGTWYLCRTRLGSSCLHTGYMYVGVGQLTRLCNSFPSSASRT